METEMKKTILASVVAIACSSSVIMEPIVADVTETRIAQIRKQYAAINAKQKQYRKVALTNDETGDTSIESYFEGKQLRKTFFGGYVGTKATEHEYYFRDGRLFFMFHRIRDNGVSRENRFYLHNGRLLRWLDKNKNPVSPSSARFLKYERNLQTSERFWQRNAANPDRIGNDGSSLNDVFLTIE
jgi:hypothetical protein